MRKLTKTQVISLLKKGECEIGFVPCKANLNSMWISPMWLTLASVEDFEKAINEYTYYNCNKEVGNYPHFYVKGGAR